MDAGLSGLRSAGDYSVVGAGESSEGLLQSESCERLHDSNLLIIKLYTFEKQWHWYFKHTILAPQFWGDMKLSQYSRASHRL
jgi:hypothetical protein